MMKRLFGRSCFGLLVLTGLGCTVALFVFSIVFQQSQPSTSNVTMTQAMRASAILPLAVSVTPGPLLIPTDDISIQVESDVTNTPATTQSGQSPDVPAVASLVPATASTNVPLESTATDVPRNSGTSTYPLTVTAQVMLAQTNVARYQAGVAATRTAIAAESDAIYATLTDQAAQRTEPSP